MTESDISIYHSGGTLNNDPENDLGGNISSFQISYSLDNLFDSLTSSESLDGRIDYRCFYIKNNNLTDILRKTKIWINQKISGSYIEIGIEEENEIQEIEIIGTPNEDETLILNLEGTNFTTTYSHNLSKWKMDFQNQIRTINGFNDVIVDINGEVPNITFTINFLGQSSKKDISIMTVITNNLNASVNITEINPGKPINAIANTIATKFIAPTNVKFKLPGKGNPIELGNLNPNDYFAVWTKRTTPANTFKKTNDNFTLIVSGGSV